MNKTAVKHYLIHARTIIRNLNWNLCSCSNNRTREMCEEIQHLQCWKVGSPLLYNETDRKIFVRTQHSRANEFCRSVAQCFQSIFAFAEQVDAVNVVMRLVAATGIQPVWTVSVSSIRYHRFYSFPHGDASFIAQRMKYVCYHIHRLCLSLLQYSCCSIFWENSFQHSL